MGLDAIDLKLDVESAFGIQIPDERFEKIRTVADLYAIVLEQTSFKKRDANTCLSIATFFLLRRSLIPFVSDRHKLRPSSRLEATLPLRGRQELWTRLAREMDIRLPPLCSSNLVNSLALMFVVLVTALTTIYMAQALGRLTFLVGFVTFLVSSVLAFWATSLLARHPSKTFQNYRGLVEQVILLNYGKLSERFHSWNPTTVWNVLQLTVADSMGAKKDEVIPSAHFWLDLGG